MSLLLKFYSLEPLQITAVVIALTCIPSLIITLIQRHLFIRRYGKDQIGKINQTYVSHHDIIKDPIVVMLKYIGILLVLMTSTIALELIFIQRHVVTSEQTITFRADSIEQSTSISRYYLITMTSDDVNIPIVVDVAENNPSSILNALNRRGFTPHNDPFDINNIKADLTFDVIDYDKSIKQLKSIFNVDGKTIIRYLDNIQHRYIR